MAARKVTILPFVYTYLLLSINPINSFRVKYSTDRAALKLGEAQDLVKELQEVIHMHGMSQKGNATTSASYIGESWATCRQRKADFERRSEKVQLRYEEVKSDGKVTLTEGGWVLLKLYSLASTFIAAEKQGCEWVDDKDADHAVLQNLIADTKEHIPCYDAAMSSIQGESKTDADKINGISILMSEDCQAHVDMSAITEENKAQLAEAEEMDEMKAFEASKDVRKLMNSTSATTSLIQAASSFAESFHAKLTTGTPGEQGEGGIVNNILWFIGIILTIILVLVGIASSYLVIYIAGFVFCLFLMIFQGILSGSTLLGQECAKGHFWIMSGGKR